MKKLTKFQWQQIDDYDVLNCFVFIQAKYIILFYKGCLLTSAYSL